LDKQKREQDRLVQERRERVAELAKKEAERRDREVREAAKRETDRRALEELNRAGPCPAGSRGPAAARGTALRERWSASAWRRSRRRRGGGRPGEGRGGPGKGGGGQGLQRLHQPHPGEDPRQCQNMPPDIAGNPEGSFDVVQLPTGEIISAEIRKSSGSRAYDDAVLRAILKSSPLPKPDSPDLFQRNLTLQFRPRE
jgi:TonB family protein